MVHRDLKPSNILVTDEGEPRLLDFGIATLDSQTGEAAVTRTVPMLTPEYASLEQVRGIPVTTASDVYQLGLLLFELLTGNGPSTSADGARRSLNRSSSNNPCPDPASSPVPAMPRRREPRPDKQLPLPRPHAAR